VRYYLTGFCNFYYDLLLAKSKYFELLGGIMTIGESLIGELLYWEKYIRENQIGEMIGENQIRKAKLRKGLGNTKFGKANLGKILGKTKLGKTKLEKAKLGKRIRES